MTDPPSLLDPEVTELLSEIANDPRSTLLRVPEIRHPLAFAPPVSPGEPFLTSAERKLLEVRRAEVAGLLYDAAKWALQTGPEGWTMNRWLTVDHEVPPVDEARLKHSVRECLTNVPGEDDLLAAVSLLARCVCGTHELDAVKLAQASLRLHPCGRARYAMGLGLVAAGELHSARVLLQNLVARESSALIRSISIEELGYLQWRLGRAERSYELYGRSTELVSNRTSSLLSMLMVALRSGEGVQALHASEMLEESVPPEHPSIIDLVTRYRRAKHRGSWRPSKPFEQCIQALVDRVPSASREVMNAFL